MEQIRPFGDSIHYVLPKLLLVATAWDEALSDTGTQSRSSQTTDDAGEIPLGVAEGTRKIPMVDPKSATGRVRELFEDIKQTHGHPGVASYYRSLGHWPEFLGLVWERIRPRVASPEYEQRKRELIKQANDALRDLPGIGYTHAEAGENQGEIRSILAVFRFKLIPDLLLDVVMIEAMLDGAEAATQSRLSAETALGGSSDSG
jgi:hypothetical protein